MTKDLAKIVKQTLLEEIAHNPSRYCLRYTSLLTKNLQETVRTPTNHPDARVFQKTITSTKKPTSADAIAHESSRNSVI